jgi:protein-disulfide isomerase
MNISSERRSGLSARLELLATILLIVVTVLVGGLTIWDRLHPQPARAAGPEPALPRDPVSIAGAPIRGDRKARVALIEFSDFECSYCGR